MPTFRAVIQRTAVSRETVEFQASDALAAAHKLNEYTVDRASRRARGISVTRTHEDDPNATETDRVVQILER
jgi:hypothetical protein